jgi:hypothetical protein
MSCQVYRLFQSRSLFCQVLASVLSVKRSQSLPIMVSVHSAGNVSVHSGSIVSIHSGSVVSVLYNVVTNSSVKFFFHFR